MSEMRTRGIRGAVTIPADEPEEIAAAARRLLTEIVARNDLELEDVASVLFTLTPDIRSAFPALAARDMGWTHVPMLHSTEIDVPGALGRCIRVLVHANTAKSMMEIEHVYLGEAASLRPDLVKPGR